MAIYQARFLKYLHGRGLADTGDRKVWAFLGDGEMDEPESLGAISLAGREKLDNLVFVINCNLQRLDGPVRGNGKIIQELEAIFRGAGWNVIKVLWGSGWDKLIAADTTRHAAQADGGVRRRRVPGLQVQERRLRPRALLRQAIPSCWRWSPTWTDDEIWALIRGGHDPCKVYAAYAAAVNHKGQPTVILAKTVKGYGMGEAGEGQNITHQQKKMGEACCAQFRDRFEHRPDRRADPRDPVPPASPRAARRWRYLHARRKALGGYLPARRQQVGRRSRCRRCRPSRRS